MCLVLSALTSSPVSLLASTKGGRTRTDKIGVGAGVDTLLPPVQPRSGVDTYRQNRYRGLQGGQFRE